MRKLGRDAAPAVVPLQAGQARDTSGAVGAAPQADMAYPAKITLAHDWIGNANKVVENELS